MSRQNDHADIGEARLMRDEEEAIETPRSENSIKRKPLRTSRNSVQRKPLPQNPNYATIDEDDVLSDDAEPTSPRQVLQKKQRPWAPMHSNTQFMWNGTRKPAPTYSNLQQPRSPTLSDMDEPQDPHLEKAATEPIPLRLQKKRSTWSLMFGNAPRPPTPGWLLPRLSFAPFMEDHDGHYWCHLCQPGISYHHCQNDPDCPYDDCRCDLHQEPMIADEEAVPLDAETKSINSLKEDRNLVTWEGPNDPANPLNWTKSKKWTATLLVSCFTFISPVSSTMVAPALDRIGDEFGITAQIERVLVMSIFLLAYAVGPFVIGPLSEIFGRVRVLQCANMIYLIFNTACGFATNTQQMMAFRFLSGLGGAAPQAITRSHADLRRIGGGVLSDCWSKEERGMSVGIYSLAPFLGPAIGPIAGGFITQYSTWRWIFWSTSIVDLAVQIAATLFLNETYAPAILHKRAKKLRKETGNNDLHTKWETPEQSFAHVLRKNLVRPFIMLGTQPAIQAMAVYRAYLYGLMYLAFATFPRVWREAYGWSISISTLPYASLGVGFVIGLQITAPLNDKIYKYLKVKYNSPGIPEFRIPLMLPGGCLIPVGLLIYGWCAQRETHWIGPNFGAGMFACGLIIAFQCAQAYVVDAYTRYAASATGAVAFLRTMAGFGFPLFADALFDRFGLGGANSLLAGISAFLGVVSPILLWKYGQWLRAKSTYCSG